MNLDQQIQKSKARHSKKGETWVPPCWITDVTGWRKEKLRLARKHGLVQFKEDGAGYLYLLESINPVFLKNQQTQNQ